MARVPPESIPAYRLVHAWTANSVWRRNSQAWSDGAKGSRTFTEVLGKPGCADQRDHQVGRALALIHRAPEKAWSVTALAKEAAMSRSGFSAHKYELRRPPIPYLLARKTTNFLLEATSSTWASAFP